jgi:hypothetical protein
MYITGSMKQSWWLLYCKFILKYLNETGSLTPEGLFLFVYKNKYMNNQKLKFNYYWHFYNPKNIRRLLSMLLVL